MHHRAASHPGGRVACRQHVSGESIFSDFTVEVVPTTTFERPGLDPLAATLRMTDLYFSTLPRLSWGIARARRRETGSDGKDSSPRTELYLGLAPFLPLITLGRPHTDRGPDRVTISYPVIGGLLSRRPSRGALVFEVALVAQEATLAVRVQDFSSSLAGDCSSVFRRALYRSTQWLLHRLLVTRFLRLAARDFSHPGSTAGKRIVKE
jgi:hypothetical protein